MSSYKFVIEIDRLSIDGVWYFCHKVGRKILKN